MLFYCLRKCENRAQTKHYQQKAFWITKLHSFTLHQAVSKWSINGPVHLGASQNAQIEMSHVVSLRSSWFLDNQKLTTSVFAKSKNECELRLSLSMISIDSCSAQMSFRHCWLLSFLFASVYKEERLNIYANIKTKQTSVLSTDLLISKVEYCLKTFRTSTTMEK